MSYAHLAKIEKISEECEFLAGLLDPASDFDSYTFLPVVDQLGCIVETSSTSTKARQLIDEIGLDRDSLTPTQVQKMEHFLNDYDNVFADGSGKVGCISVVRYDIKLKDGARPFKSRPYKARPVQRAII